jgi:hypothetical protein
MSQFISPLRGWRINLPNLGYNHSIPSGFSETKHKPVKVRIINLMIVSLRFSLTKPKKSNIISISLQSPLTSHSVQHMEQIPFSPNFSYS